MHLPLRALSAFACVVLTGCIALPHAMVHRAAARYAQVHGGMTRAEVVALLGEPRSLVLAAEPTPASRRSDASLRWYVDDGEVTAELLVQFANDRVVSIARSVGPQGRSLAMVEPGRGMTPFPYEERWVAGQDERPSSPVQPIR